MNKHNQHASEGEFGGFFSQIVPDGLFIIVIMQITVWPWMQYRGPFSSGTKHRRLIKLTKNTCVFCSHKSSGADHQLWTNCLKNMKLTAFSLHLKVKPLFLVSTLTTISECACCVISWSVCCNLSGKCHGLVENLQKKPRTKFHTPDSSINLFLLQFPLTLFDSFVGNCDYVTRWLARMCDYFCLGYRGSWASLCTPLLGAKKRKHTLV